VSFIILLFIECLNVLYLVYSNVTCLFHPLLLVFLYYQFVIAERFQVFVCYTYIHITSRIYFALKTPAAAALAGAVFNAVKL
jgi:hypothetical protein